MSKKIKIKCNSKNEKDIIIDTLKGSSKCPFNFMCACCGGYSSCKKCIENNIKFKIRKEED